MRNKVYICRNDGRVYWYDELVTRYGKVKCPHCGNGSFDIVGSVEDYYNAGIRRKISGGKTLR